MGPHFLSEILAILLRFRLHHSAIVGDITQALLQLVLDEEDLGQNFLVQNHP
jgi:hypothetical protein